MFRKNSRKRRGGFSLIEILLVAGILAVIAAFAVPNLLGTAREAKINLTKSQIGRNGAIADALRRYKFAMGKFPDTDEGLQVLFMPRDKVDDERYAGPYLEGYYEELGDAWEQPFEYRHPGEMNEDGYDIWSIGPDGKNDDGKEGSDDIKNWIEK